MFPALSISYTFSQGCRQLHVPTCHQLHVYPCLPPDACFPALAIGSMFSRACHQLHVFPHLPSVACFPAHATRCMFSRACHRLHVSLSCKPVACFPALAIICMFSRACHYSLHTSLRCHQFHVFRRLLSVASVFSHEWRHLIYMLFGALCFPALGTFLNCFI